ncbi:MAG: UDP-N-acetylmuramoyl-tripeptide--D-alanyl-D-alanine ligase [Sphingomonadales bacterium]
MNDYLWTFTEILKSIDGYGPVTGGVFGIAIDNRETYPGDLFIALPGNRTDGHKFVKKAFGMGAAAALVSKKPRGLRSNDPRLIWVPDTYEALLKMAATARVRSAAKIIAVTGTAGKTGTKDALAAALGMRGLTHSSIKSFNNHVGVPLSLARLPRNAEFGVFEVGMSAPGDIAPLARLIRPHVALITTIGAGHLGAFASEEEIAREKAAIFEGLSTAGTVILNRDNTQFVLLKNLATSRGIKRILDFSTHDLAATAILLERQTDGRSSQVAAKIGGVRVDYRIALPGRHWVTNSLGVLVAVEALGGDLGLAGLALATLVPQDGRGALYDILSDQKNFQVVDESYNANPASMAATLEVFAELKPHVGLGRKIAVLGDMEELGSRAGDEHLSLIPMILAAKVDVLYLKGKRMGALQKALKKEIKIVAMKSNAGIFKRLSKDIEDGDLILVKGSRAGGLDEIVDQLLALHEETESETNEKIGWGAPVAAAE